MEVILRDGVVAVIVVSMSIWVAYRLWKGK